MEEFENIETVESENTQTPRRRVSRKAKRLVVIVSALAVAVAIFATVAWALGLFSPKPQKAATPASSSAAVSKTATSGDEEWLLYDEGENPQNKVVANGSFENSLSSDPEEAAKQLLDNAKHHVEGLKHAAIQYSLVDDVNYNVKNWVEEHDGRRYLNQAGQKVWNRYKEILDGSKKSVQTLGNVSAVSAGTVNGEVVLDNQTRNFNGWQAVKVEPKGGGVFYNLLYCGNPIYPSSFADKGGVPRKAINLPKEPPKTEPKKPTPPAPTPKVEAKQPAQDPYNQGNAPVGGGVKAESGTGNSETSQQQLPDVYVAPSAPAASSSSSQTPAPAQGSSSASSQSSITPPSSWTGNGSFTDSNGTTVVGDSGSVSTPDGRTYDGLKNSVPAVQSGANPSGGTSGSSSSAVNDGAISEPPIND